MYGVCVRIGAGITCAMASLALSATAQATDGKDVYQKNCVACHQPGGEGMPPAFPSLKGSEAVNGSTEDVVKLVLEGKAGTAMVSFAHVSDDELAAVLSYIRSSWGNTGEAVTAEHINAQR